jgi:hypothetical protein
MPGTPLPTPPIRVGDVGLRTLARNIRLRDDLRAAAVDAQAYTADIWMLAFTQVLDKHGYRLEIFKD